MNSILTKYKNSGNLKLWLDFRSGHVNDMSGNGSVVSFATGARITNVGLSVSGTGYLSIPSNTNISITQGTVIVLFKSIDRANGRLISKRDGISGTMYDIYFNSSTDLRCYDGTGDRFLVSTYLGKKCIGMNLNSGSATKVYIDGVYLNVLSVTNTISANNSILYIGNIYAASSPNPDVIQAILIFNTLLNDTEHAQVFSELSNLKLPSRTSIISRPSLFVPQNGLIGSWDLGDIQGVTCPDRSGNNNSGTAFGGPVIENTGIGKSLKFDNVDSYVNLNAKTLSGQGARSVSLWFKATLTAANQFMFAEQLGSGGHRGLACWITATTGVLDCMLSDSVTSGGFLRFQTSAGYFDNKWHHYVFAWDGTTNVNAAKVYVDGAVAGQGTATNTTQGGISTYNSQIGATNSGASGLYNGLIKSVNIYNRALDATTIKAIYDSGKTALHSSGWGVNVSSANEGGVTGGYLSNTPFQFGDTTGRWQIVTSTINGTLVKAIKCITAGVLYVPTSIFQQSATEAAYGEFNFYTYIHGGAYYTIQYISNVNAAYNVAGTNAYMFFFYPAGPNTIQFRQYTNGVLISANFYTTTNSWIADTWTKFKISRTPAGITTVRINDILTAAASGANPFTDNTHTISNFMLFTMTAGDMISLGSINGSYNFRKGLFV